MKKCRGNVICSWLGEDSQCQVNSDFCPYLESKEKRQLCRDDEFYAAFGARFSFEKPKTYQINFSQVKTIEDIKMA